MILLILQNTILFYRKTIYKHTTVQKCGVGMIYFNVFKGGLLWSSRLHLFDQKYSKYSNIIRYYYHLNIYLLFYIIVMQSWILSSHYSSLQYHKIL